MTNEPTLKRDLSLAALVLFGLSYMTPMIVYGTFGILSSATFSAVPSAYVIALGAMIFTALSYGQMAKRYPMSGSAYSYAVKSFGPTIGFYVGWAVLLDYLFLPMVIWLIGAAYLSEAFPAVPSWLWLIGFVTISTAINIIGLKVANRVNLVVMAAQIFVIILFSVLLLVYLAETRAPGGHSLTAPFTGTDFSYQAIVAGAAIAAYSFLGFDAVSTLAEEAKDAQRNIPRAILAVTVIGGLIFISSSYVAQLAFPTNDFVNPDAAASEMALAAGGILFKSIFIATLIFAQLASGIAAQASGARLIYVMARDGVLPKTLLGRLHKTYCTPYVAILITGAIGLLALAMDITTSTSFINFGAMSAFFVVNLSLIVHYKRETDRRSPYAVVQLLIFPAIGAATSLFLLANLQIEAVTLGVIWVGAGFVYLAFLTGFFSRPVPTMRAGPP